MRGVVAGRFSSSHSLTTATVTTLPQELDILHVNVQAMARLSTVGDSMGYGNLQFDQWFETFLNASTPVHPYATGD